MKKKTVSYLLSFLVAVFIMCPLALRAAQPSAQASIEKMVGAMKKNPSLDIVFTVWQNGNSSSGSMTVAGKMFHLSTPEMKIWYDGQTQWTYAVSAGEVNVTEPTPEELAQSNPLSLLSGLNRNFTFRRLKATPGEEKIELVPKKKSPGLASATVVLNSSTSLPRELTVKDGNGRTVTVKISSVKGGKTKPRSLFRFDSRKYPEVEVVDLR